MMLAQELAHMRHTGISASLVKGGAELLCVQTHAAELIDMKRTAETANPLLPENGRAAILAPHGDVADQEQGGEYDQGDKGQKTIPYTLHVTLEGGHPIRDKISRFINTLFYKHGLFVCL